MRLLAPALTFAALLLLPAGATARPCVGHHRCAPAHRRRARTTGVARVVAPVSDARAASLVRSAPELRPGNDAANHTRLTPAQIADFRARERAMPRAYVDRIDGAYVGTTDEIIQWAARKWGLQPDLLRAVATVESWWKMSTVGDGGDSFGLFQIRRPYHCCPAYAQGSTAFNADYYGAIIRSYDDGTQTWLTTVSGNGRPYRRGDLWGSVGAWYSGRWHDAGAEAYVQRVRDAVARRPWRRPGF